MTVGAACSSPSLGFFGAGLATSRVPELKRLHDLQAYYLIGRVLRFTKLYTKVGSKICRVVH